jgi:superfamily II DNA or RNA helicase
MFIYILTSKTFSSTNDYKIGLTTIDPKFRLSTYITGCPPTDEQIYDTKYLHIWRRDDIDEMRLKYYEKLIHNKFKNNRKIRRWYGDSEWFNFDDEMLSYVVNFITELGFKIIENVDEYNDTVNYDRSERLELETPYDYNVYHIDDSNHRLSILNELQKPIEQKLTDFILNADENDRAVQIIAPCGFGKTKITVNALINCIEYDFCCVILCPSRLVMKQWYDEISSNDKNNRIEIIRNNGSIDVSNRTVSTERKIKIILSCNQSSHNLLKDDIIENINFVIVDEAHHLVGKVSKDAKGEGKTRTFFDKIIQLDIMRISLTFTPKFIDIEDLKNNDCNILCMRDERTFGIVLEEIKLRDLIQRGILPDYRLWSMRSDNDITSMDEKTILIEKIAMISNAWRAKEVKDGTLKHVINHLLIYVQNNQEGKDVETLLKAIIANDEVLRVDGEDPEKHDKLNDFKNSHGKRRILISCKLLGEGVDLPIADSVMILNTKNSIIETTQTILRAGRWQVDKELFHILIPMIKNDDNETLESVLLALSNVDDRIYDIVKVKNTTMTKNEKKEQEVKDNREVNNYNTTFNTNLIVDTFGSDWDSVLKCFGRINDKIMKLKADQIDYTNATVLNVKIGVNSFGAIPFYEMMKQVYNTTTIEDIKRYGIIKYIGKDDPIPHKGYRIVVDRHNIILINIDANRTMKAILSIVNKTGLFFSAEIKLNNDETITVRGNEFVNVPPDITTSIQYKRYKEQNRHLYLPDKPPNNMTWFDYLNPNVVKVPVDQFKSLILDKHTYDKWKNGEINPSVENINDGYYTGYNNANCFIHTNRLRR